MKYVMFLRGINVGGIKVPMIELRKVLDSVQLVNIKTYLQTGNVMFESTKAVSVLKTTIEKRLSEQFNYKAFVLIYPASILDKVIKKYPFPSKENMHQYVIFCENKKVAMDLITLKPGIDLKVEDIAKGENVIYWTVPKGSTSQTAFSKILTKPSYKSVTTTRNLNTLQKMI